MTIDAGRENVCHQYRDIAGVLRRPAITRIARRLHFGRSVAKARKDLQLTQDQLAAEVGLGKNRVSKLECGKAGVRKRHKAAVIDYLGIEEPEGGL